MGQEEQKKVVRTRAKKTKGSFVILLLLLVCMYVSQQIRLNDNVHPHSNKGKKTNHNPQVATYVDTYLLAELLGLV
jgi:hypothetical protein